jgi:signal transduction histidine kinase
MRSAMEIAAAVGGDTDLTRTLELIATRARSLVRASALLIWLRHGDELRIAAVSGDATVPADATMPIDESTAGDAIRGRSSSRSEDAQGMRVSPARFGMPDASSSLVVPLLHHGRGLGVLMAFDHRGALASFDPDDERALEAFAASAATAVATARLVEEQRLHDSMAAAEHERGRWARELHDETLQGLAGLKLILARALRAPDLARHELESAMAQVDADIGALRTIIADLRPAALDELGLEPALRTLVERVGQSAGLETRLSTALGETRLGSHVETVAYRVVQEALTNVVRHAGAVAVAVDVLLDDARLRITISDDGRGISSPRDGGYGIVGMRERAALAGGTVSVAPVAGGGTRVALTLPVS